MKFQMIAAVWLYLVTVNALPSKEHFGSEHYRVKGYLPKTHWHTFKPVKHPESRKGFRTAPPDHTKLISMARYVLHTADWASVATISSLPAIRGYPFANVKSVVDGPLNNSTGIPYFYMAPADFTARDLRKNSRATVQVSLEESRYCESQRWDPEDPRCTRLMLSGKITKVKENTPEYKFAQAALFQRHPDMINWPKDHKWFVAKLKIAQIAMVDWFGGAKLLPVRDYLAYNYTTRSDVLFRAVWMQAQNEITYV